MGLLNRSKKPPKLICPSCGKANDPAGASDGPRRCRICRTILPQTVAQPEGGIDFGSAGDSGAPRSSGPSKSGIEHEPFDMEGLKMTTFDKVAQGPSAARDLAPEPLLPVVSEQAPTIGAYGGPAPINPDAEPFDPNGLVIGEPADPRPTE